MASQLISEPAAPALTRVPVGTSAEEVRAIVLRDGGVILQGALTRAQVDQVNRDLDPHFGTIGQGNLGASEDNFVADFMGHKTKRLVHCLRYSETFRNAFLANETLLGYVAALVPGAPGCHSLMSSQGIEIYPGEKAQDLHRDANTHRELLGMTGPGGPEILVNMLLALTDVTEEMGATRVIPRSNVWDDFETEADPADTIPALLDAGDVLFISGKVLHGGGANVTADRPRRVLSTADAIPFFMGEEAWPFALPWDEVRTYPAAVQAGLNFRSISMHGEQPGYLWRVDGEALEKVLAGN
jgi:ectoine hydroxylase-related dioxygenase (phytanoyl-CoA dioxygenase family)